MDYADLYRDELARFRGDLPILTSEKCRTLSLLLSATVRSVPTGIAATSQRKPSESAGHAEP